MRLAPSKKNRTVLISITRTPMEAQLSNGTTVTLKSIFTRKLKKQIKSLMFRDMTLGSDGKMQGVNLAGQDEADDALILGMVEKAVDADGKKITFDQQCLDELPADDVDMLLAQINKLIGKKKPAK